jgi:RNA polymerase sigma-70 factor (family 1)
LSLSDDYNEKVLLSLLAQGDHFAFERLFSAHKDKLYSFLLHLTGSASMAQDILQDVFLRIWLKREEATSIDNFSSYLFRAARNQAINGFKRNSRAGLLIAELSRESGSTVDTDDPILARELKVLLGKAINSLPVQQRKVFELSRNEGFKYEEIAEKLGISTSTVRNHMIQALKKIREHIGNTYPLYILMVVFGES